jgi:elongation factor Ts
LQVTTEDIRALRERTGAGIMDSKRALEESNGDMAQAEAALRAKGIVRAGEKAGRATGEGIVDCYLHAGNKIGAMVELNCETDFVARTDEFKELAHNLAMQVAAMSPVYITPEEIPQDESRKPEEISLLSQAFIRDGSKTVNDLVLDMQARVRENIQIRRFVRFSLGD